MQAGVPVALVLTGGTRNKSAKAKVSKAKSKGEGGSSTKSAQRDGGAIDDIFGALGH